MSASSGGLGRPRVGVLAVQGAFAEHERALAAAGSEPVQVRGAAQLEGLDAIVLPGGESTTLGLVAEGSGLLGALRERLDEGMPALGTCAGMIVLARATTGGAQPLVGGMDIVVRRNAFGRQRASFETSLAVPALGPEPVEAVFIRAPWIERHGEDVEVLASWEGHPVAIRDGNVLACSFHPELTDDSRVHALLMAMATGARERAGRETERTEVEGMGG